MKNIPKLTSNQEDYLEVILILERKNKVARVKEISNMLDVKMPSVTGALKILKEKGVVVYEKNSYINLTKEGLKIAECILDRHNILVRFFDKCLKLDGREIENQACMIEHVISHETAVRLSNLTDWVDQTVLKDSKVSDTDWLEMLQK